MGVLFLAKNETAAMVCLMVIYTAKSSTIPMKTTLPADSDNHSTLTEPPTFMPSNSTVTNSVLSWLGKIRIPVFMGCTCLSLVTCVVAFAAYVIIREVKEVKSQTIHWINWHLLSAFILRDAMLMIGMTLFLMPEYAAVVIQTQWRVAVVYTVIPNFFWMFAEGLYLYLGVFHPFWIQSFRWKKPVMFSIGWILPTILITVWVLQQYITNGNFVYTEVPGLVCILAPVYTVLLLNLFMMARVICTFADKLNANIQNLDTMKKLAKFTIGISILLGVPQLVPMIITHAEKSINSTVLIVLFVNSIWSAMQGFFVAIFYVLTNKDVLSHTKRRLSSLTPPPSYV